MKLRTFLCIAALAATRAPAIAQPDITSAPAGVIRIGQAMPHSGPAGFCEVIHAASP